MFRLKMSLLILALALTVAASKPPSGQGSEMMARDAGGHRLNLLSGGIKAAVFFFITNDCPITNSYIPEINRIAAAYEPRKIAFYAVYTDSTASIPEIRKHAREFGLKCRLIPDPAHVLVHQVGATVTPEAAVLDGEGKLVYLGPIDDLYFDFGKRRPEPTQAYVRHALDAILKGKPVAIPKAHPIGCFIPAEP